MAQYMYSKARLVLEFECRLRSASDPIRFPTWLQILKPKEAADSAQTWAGRVAYVKDHMGRVKELVEKVDKKVEQIEKKTADHFAVVQAKQQMFQADQFKMMQKLDAVIAAMGTATSTNT